MKNVFAKRRARLLAMKAIRDNYIPDDKLVSCPNCGEGSQRKNVTENLCVCPLYGYYFPIGAYYRLSTILDPGSFRELNEKLPAADPLSFPGYREKQRVARYKTGLTEAAVTAAGTIGGRKCVIGVLDSRFMMGGMSTAVGEKITLAIEYAAKNKNLYSQRRGKQYNQGMKQKRKRKPYPSDLTDEQWKEIAPLYVGMRTCKWSKRELRTCIHNRRTPSGRIFCRHTALISLEIRQDFCGKLPCLAAKSFTHPASAGYEYRF